MSASVVLIACLIGLATFADTINAQPAAAEYFKSAFDLYQSKRCDAAIGLFDKGLAIDPKNGVAHYYAGLCAEELGQRQEAQTHFAQSIWLAPSSKEAGLAEVKLRQFRDAAQDAKMAQEKRAKLLAEVCFKPDAGATVVIERGLLRQLATEIEWTQADNGQDIGWKDAAQWCTKQGQGWQLPTVNELQCLRAVGSTRCGAESCRVSTNFSLSGDWFWSSELRDGATAYIVDLKYPACGTPKGSQAAAVLTSTMRQRTLCVRYR